MELFTPALAPPPVYEKPEWIGTHEAPTDPRKKAQWLKHRELAWDNTVRKYTPMVMKGIKPTTYEPWSDDVLANVRYSPSLPAAQQHSRLCRARTLSQAHARNAHSLWYGGDDPQ